MSIFCKTKCITPKAVDKYINIVCLITIDLVLIMVPDGSWSGTSGNSGTPSSSTAGNDACNNYKTF